MLFVFPLFVRLTCQATVYLKGVLLCLPVVWLFFGGRCVCLFSSVSDPLRLLPQLHGGGRADHDSSHDGSGRRGGALGVVFVIRCCHVPHHCPPCRAAQHKVSGDTVSQPRLCTVLVGLSYYCAVFSGGHVVRIIVGGFYLSHLPLATCLGCLPRWVSAPPEIAGRSGNFASSRLRSFRRKHTLRSIAGGDQTHFRGWHVTGWTSRGCRCNEGLY